MRKGIFLKSAAAALLVSAITSCAEKDLYQPQQSEPLAPESEYFGFKTSGTVSIDVNYGALAGGSLISIYTSNPMEGVTEENPLPTIEPVFRGNLDSNGRLAQDFNLPTAASKIYIYSEAYAAPTLTEAEVKGGKIVVNTPAARSSRAAASRAVENPQLFPVEGTNMKSLFSGCDIYGNVQDYDDNNLLSAGDLSANFYSDVQTVLWNGAKSKPSGLNNSKYAVGSDVTNTKLLSRAVNPETGEEEDVKFVEIFMTFVGEAAWNENSVGYYYYDSANPPTSPSEVKRYLVFPNTSIPNNQPYGMTGKAYVIDNQYAPLKNNQKVQLLYEDEEGNVSTKFPTGITVGYFLISNPYADSSKHLETPAYNGRTTYYSNETLNPKSGIGKAAEGMRFIALEAKDGSLVYGVEDSNGDYSADDMLFTISASPNFAMDKPEELPSIKEELDKIFGEETPEEERNIYTSQTTKATYAFEDIWPDGGDYDLNDVIVEHTRTITFNQKNYVSEVLDEFAPVQPAGSADFADAFAVQINPNFRENIIFSSPSILDEKETSSVILFENASAVAGRTFTIKRTFGNSLSSGVQKSVFDKEDLKPYIISQYVKGATDRTEIHMPKDAGTKYANASLAGTADDAYYINKDGKHPFAITLPITGWVPAQERVCVSTAFPNFDKWVESNGTQAKDWYLKR